jgi:hypothetical protein
MKEVIELLERAVTQIHLVDGSSYLDFTLIREAEQKINNALHELRHPRRYTPEQWKELTGEDWPEGWAVYVLVRNKYTKKKEYRWEAYPYTATKSFTGGNPIVCATEAGKPPKGWRPEKMADRYRWSDKCSHISGKTADDCLECDYLKPGPLEGSGICEYPINQRKECKS